MGGSFERGRTSNVELDAVLSKHLPKGKTLPCHALPSLDGSAVEEIVKRLRVQKRLYFPLFLRHHWIAGILRLGQRENAVLEIFDSAPSPIVHRDLRRCFRRHWPQLTIRHGVWTHQEKESSDCGIFMASKFFSDHLGIPFPPAKDQIATLRHIFTLIRDGNVADDEVPPLIRKALLPRSAATLSGGDDFDLTADTSTDDDPAMAYDPLLSSSEDDVETPSAQGRPTDTQPRQPAQGTINSTIHEILCLPEKDKRRSHLNGIGHWFAAVALANAGDGMKRSMSLNSVGMRVYRHKESGGTPPTDVPGALGALGVMVGAWGKHSKESDFAADGPGGDILYLRVEKGSTLPSTIGHRTFRLGSGPVVLNDKSAMVRSHGVTTNRIASSVGLYIPQDLLEYPTPTKKPKTGNRAVTQNSNHMPTATVAADAPLRSEQGEQGETALIKDEFSKVLAVAPGTPLNRHGSPERGQPVTCPRTWHVYSQRPPHVSGIAWGAVTEAVRLHHIRCLMKLKAMPYRLLNTNIASAVLETVRLDAVARGWAPSTIAKECAAMAGALRDLPIYTTEREGVILGSFPEWKAAQTTIKRLEREMDKTCPAPIRYDEYRKAVRQLRTQNPNAALFLSMMWALAARAGDVASLRKVDVNLKKEANTNNLVPLSIVQKFGKGAKFRGTYWPASALEIEDAGELRRLLTTREAKQRLFPNDDDLRVAIRSALQKQNRESALPSVRKGAIRHLARQGVPEADLMRLTGHTRLETLYRYIGVGHPVTREAVTAQGSAALLHHQAQTSSG